MPNDLARSIKVSGIFITSWRGVKRCQLTSHIRRLLNSSFIVLSLVYIIIHDDTAVIMYRSWFYVTFVNFNINWRSWREDGCLFHLPSRWLQSRLFRECSTNFPLIIIIFSLSCSLPVIFVPYLHTLRTSLYVSPTSFPVWVPWNYVCMIHGPPPPPGQLTYRHVHVRLFCLCLPQPVAPHPSTRFVRLGTCFSSIN